MATCSSTCSSHSHLISTHYHLEFRFWDMTHYGLLEVHQCFVRNELPPHLNQATSKYLLSDYNASFSRHTHHRNPENTLSLCNCFPLPHSRHFAKANFITQPPSLRAREVTGSLGLIMKMEKEERKWVMK